MLIQLIREILIVGQAKKVNIGEDDYEWAISTIDAMAPESNSSLFRDIQSNRPSELHSIHGFLVREAERLSVDVRHSDSFITASFPRRTWPANPDATNLLQNVFDYLFRYLKSLSCFIRNIP